MSDHLHHKSATECQPFFTLIELLVVIAIIAVLAAILLPALAKGRDRAMRVVCLGDRRQNGVSVFLFGSDNDGLVPPATGVQDANGAQGLELGEYLTWHPTATASSMTDHSELQHSVKTHENNSQGNVFALGTLARFGYVGSPEQLYCPTFVRDNSGIQWNLDADPLYWYHLTKGELRITHGAEANAYRYNLGVSHLMFIHGASVYQSRARTKISYIADNWRSDPGATATTLWRYGVSPILLACRQSSSPSALRRVEILETGVELSHKGEGVNAVFYDGSARWISVAEVQQAGWQTNTHDYDGYYLSSQYPAAYLLNSHAQDTAGYVGNFVAWARAALE